MPEVAYAEDILHALAHGPGQWTVTFGPAHRFLCQGCGASAEIPAERFTPQTILALTDLRCRCLGAYVPRGMEEGQ